MPTPAKAILNEAKKYYVSRGYGKEPVTNDKNFIPFVKKFDKALNFYVKSGWNINSALGHLDGIDFKKPVELTVIPKGTRHTQMQVAWGAKGNYFSTSDYSPLDMGISKRGRKFDYLSYDKPKRDSTIDKFDYESDFPSLPREASNQAKPQHIFDKKTVTYEASKDVPCLKSTARKITDTWSVPGEKIEVKGGGMQMFVGKKLDMKKVDLGVHDKDMEYLSQRRPSTG
jgi:type VI secretion system secreted protein VgrG